MHCFFLSGILLLVASETPIAMHVPLLPLIELASLALVFGANTLPITSRPLVFLGKLSYGIYLWHFPLVKAIQAPWYIEAAIVLPASILLAWLSFVTVERWAKHIGRRKNHSAGSTPALPT